MDQFSVCKNYEESTCCSSEEAAAVAERFLPLVKDTTITQKCYNRLQALFCAPCSGKNIGYIRNGKVTYCNDFAIE